MTVLSGEEKVKAACAIGALLWVAFLLLMIWRVP